jgi:hypothetical protein
MTNNGTAKVSRCFGRLYLRLDTSESPAMVFVQSRGKRVDSGSYWCVMQEGFDSIELTPAEQDWLLSLEDTVEAHCAGLVS